MSKPNGYYSVQGYELEDWISDVCKAHQLVEEIWQEKTPDEVENTVMQTLEAIDLLVEKLKEYR